VSFLSVLALILLLWGVITLVRRIGESEQQRIARGQRTPWRVDDARAEEAPPDERGFGRADGSTDGQADERAGGRKDGRWPEHDDDAIDYEELQRAEDEIRDLGADAKPEDGFEGDDWGPGTPRKPPLV
jgi:hypothetical protein